MADVKISALVAGSPASALAGSDGFELVQGGVSKGGVISQIGAYVRGLFTTTPATIAEGGTGAATASAARTGLQVVRDGTGTTNPTVSTDNTQGYAVGSIFINTVNGNSFIARSVATGAAVWERSGNGYLGGYLSGNWINPFFGTSSQAGSASSNTQLGLMPFFVAERVTITDLGCRIATLSAGGNAMIGIYADDPVTRKPTGAVLASVTGLTTASATVVSATLAAPVTLEAGWYWAAGEMDNATSAFATITPGFYAQAIVGSATLTNAFSASANPILQYLATNTYGTFPSAGTLTLTESLGTARSPIIVFKVQ